MSGNYKFCYANYKQSAQQQKTISNVVIVFKPVFKILFCVKTCYYIKTCNYRQTLHYIFQYSIIFVFYKSIQKEEEEEKHTKFAFALFLVNFLFSIKRFLSLYLSFSLSLLHAPSAIKKAFTKYFKTTTK